MISHSSVAPLVTVQASAKNSIRITDEFASNSTDSSFHTMKNGTKERIASLAVLSHLTLSEIRKPLGKTRGIDG
jgi:hypothetical protein